MNAEKSLLLARRFIELPQDKRGVFLETLAREGIDFSQFPIPAGVQAPDRQGLSYAQQRMWVLWQMDPQSGAYNLPGAVRLTGQLDESALEQAFASLLARHQSLTTVFEVQPDDSLLQVYRPVGEALIERVDLRQWDEAGCEAQVRAQAEAESLRPFDLAQGPLLRVRLLRLAEQEHVLLLTLHHIVSDGWSMNVLIDEFSRCYDAFAAGHAPQLPDLPIQYVDYALWQRRWLEAGELARQLAYWQAQLGDEQPVLELPLDNARPATPSFSGERRSFAVDAALAERLRGFARQHNLTPFMVMLGAFGLLLQRYTGQADLRIGSPVANRNRAEVEGLIGLFVNTQVLRVRPDAHLEVLAYLQGIKQVVHGAQAHQDLPFERLVEALKVERSLSHAPLFQVMYNHQPQVADLATVTLASGLQLSPLAWRSRTTQFDLSLDTYEQGGTLHAAFTYASDLFEAATIERMATHWQALLQALVSQPHSALWQLPMLDDASRRTVLEDWNATARGYPLERGVHQLFEDQVRRAPDAPALVCGDTALSYAQLDARANRLAHFLRAQGAGADSLVGISLLRSVEMVVGLMAILKAGAAYVPLDPEYPEERLAYMIEDSGIRLLLTHQALQGSLPVPADVQCIALDQLTLDDQPASPPQVATDPRQLAYVIYTSGSTGRPKGAGNSHEALANRLHWMQEAYGLCAGDTVLQKTPFSFDVSVWEFFWPLMTGARLAVAAPGDHRDPARLIETIRRHQVSTLHFVPSMLQAFIHESGVETCDSLRRILCSGEALPVDAQLQVFGKLPAAALYNLYGPTEAAIDVTHWTCIDEGRDSVPIGRPIANIRTYVLDAGLEPVAPGVAGELYLGGIGLARGYHRRPGLTAERFVADPFVAGQRLYRTGDRVRQRVDGVIEYLGRFDHQVKIRGLRIELGEIEARLAQHAWVREAVVLALDGKQLVAYLVLDEMPDGWQQGLKAWLLQALPEFMVPSHLMPLEQFPLTPNGKLDRKALPQPDAASRGAYVAPQTDVQRTLAQVWSEVLGVAEVGLDDNFFELGGDSIIAIQVVGRARRQGLQFSPRDLFQFQTVRGLAGAVGRQPSLAVEQAPATGEVALSPVQRQFFEQAIAVREHWNQSLLLGARQPLQAQALVAALGDVVNHHDALRLRFEPAAEGWRQHYGAPVAQVELWQRQAADAQALTALCDAAQRSLDLRSGPLLRAMLVDLPQGEQRLLLVIHHLVVDGVSWRILLEDLEQAYAQRLAGQPLSLAPRTSSYQAWSAQLHEQVPAFVGQLPYWQAQRGDGALPCDRPDAPVSNRHGAKLASRLSRERTRQLLQVAPAAYRTQVNDLLLTALARVICQWSGSQAALVQLEGHGREELFDGIDLTRTVGWFTSLYPLRLAPRAGHGDSIKAIKEQLRAVPDKGMGYGVLRYLGDASVREALATLDPPRITFNYLGQFDSQFDAQALLAPATERGGDGQDPDAPLANWLTLEGQVYNGELSLQWGFSLAMFDTDTVQALATAYDQELEALIEHCLGVPAGQPSPSDFPLARITQAQLDALPVPGHNIEDLYPLSPMQQGMFFHSLYETQGGAYINQLRLAIGGLDLERFGEAWQAALARHDILRSSIHWQGLDSAHQIVQRQLPLPLRIVDEPAADLDALARAEHEAGFDLARAPLFRLLLVRTGADDWHLVFTCHHILLDGWSNAQLLAEVVQHYAGERLSAPAGRFHDYLAWLQRQDASAGERFWKARLGALQAPTLLAQALRRPADAQGEGEYLARLDAAQAAELERFARHHKVTLNTLFQAAWGLVLQRLTGQACVAFGATVSGRSAPLPGIDGQLGLFINTLPVLIDVAPDRKVAGYLADVQDFNLSLREFEHVPLYAIQGWAGQQGAALFDSLLVFENFPVAEALRQGAPAGLRFGAVSNHERTHYPLTIGIELGDGVSLAFGYDPALFAAEQVAQLCAGLRQVLAQMVATPAAPSGALGLLDDKGQAEVLGFSHGRALALPSQELVHQRIAAQAARQPQALALQCGELRLSYGQLDGQANRLAHALIAKGVRPGQRVGLALRRGPQLIVSLLAVLKSGATYVPLDPQYPHERQAYMIEDSRLDLLLCDDGLLVELALPAGLRRLELGVLGEQAAHCGDHDPDVQVAAEQLAYVIYTSGSTGRPKGVAISHAALREFSYSATGYSRLERDDRVLQFATFSFDGFVEQCYPPLCVGAALIMRGEALWDADQLARLIVEQGVTLADLPAAYWHMLAKTCAARPGQGLGKLRQVHVGGEAMSVEGLRLWHAAGLGGLSLVNTYGPTEATVVSSVHDCRLEDAQDAYGVPIGHAIAGRSLYVLDCAGQLLPSDGVGELCIGAPSCLAQQYFDRPALTAERFLPDPFAEQPGARLYRSGDLARYTQAGVLEYVGRIDHQVKIRGMRIEMGEIEACLQGLASVREAAVLALAGPTGPQLVAYLVAAQATPSADWLQGVRAALGQALPDYMIPAHLLVLERLPLNNNGKLNRAALPAPDFSAAQQVYEAPRTPLQAQLATIWAQALQVERVGLADSFFSLGGHSLLATEVIARIRQGLGLEVPLRQLFEQPTLGAFADRCAELGQGAAAAIAVLPRTPAMAVSYAQERQWFLWRLDPQSAAYNVPAALRVRGPLELPALQSAFDQVIARHEPLRTTFDDATGELRQHIHPHLALPIVIEHPGELDDAALAAWVDAQVRAPFDLVRGPLLRVKLLAMGEQDHVLVIVQHHIVSDGASLEVLVEELLRGYHGEHCAPLPVQYADYAAWQRQWLDGGERARQLDYWLAQLGGEQVVLELPFDRPRPAQRRLRGARLDFPLEAELSHGLQQLAKTQDASLFMLLLAAFQALLHRYSGQADIRVGVPVANRTQAETERLIGFFVNTQVLRAEVDGGQGFDVLLRQTRQAALQAQAHQDLPFEQLVEALAPERNLSHSPVFQVLFNHQYAARAERNWGELRVEPLHWDSATAQFDLVLDTSETAQGLMVSLAYDTDLFERSTIERLSTHFINLLQGIVEQPHQPVAELPLLAAAERERTLVTWNATAEQYPLQQNIQQLIEAQVQRTPDAPALAFGEVRLSYAQLNARANRLAHRLIALGVGADGLVGIAVERSVEMVVGLLAILKAGGAYVPLDPDYPEDRLRYMLEDSGVQLLLTQSHLQLPLAEGVQTLALDLEPGADDVRNPNVAVAPENLAYVIYTSGSTGRPKGAGNRHSALVNRLCWMQQAYRLDARDSVLQKTPFSFDVSVWEFFWPLMTGARLVVAAPGDHRDPARLVELITSENITTLHFVPSMLQAFLQDSGVPRCTSLARIVCSGEALPADAQQQVFAKLPKAGLYNLYGPTEAAIDVTHWTCREEGRDSVPIGEPIANLACYILDAELQPVPVGVLGELYLAGAGLARGYHRRPGLTAERFAVSPYGNGERMYRTGDLARYRADGVIEYAGRIDHQVKLRGLRIELGEIEARLLEHDLVREAVVTVPDGKQLVGYVVLASEAADWQAQLAEHLRRGLPDYMVPNQWLALDSLPLSPNGKLDRKALPAVDAALVQKVYEAPANAREHRLAAVWADVLRLERVGVNDNFFELGGDSIVSIQVVGRARQQGLHFTPKELFQHQTVRGLAAVLREGEGAVKAEQGPQVGGMPLLPFQQWFFAQRMSEPQHWNQSLLLRGTETVDAAALEQALLALYAQHDALRLRFADGSAEHGPLQPAQPLLWRAALRSAEEIEATCEEAQRSLDLAQGPLLRAVLIELADGGQRLLLVIHHLVVDGVSWRVLLEDLHDAYRQALAGSTPKLPAKTSAFKAWGERLQQHAASLDSELAYWQGQLGGAPQGLPEAEPGASLQNRHRQSVQARLGAELTRRLLQQAPAAYRTQVNDLLLTALARVVCRWSGADSALVELEGHGREDLFDDIDLSRTVGWFTSAYPVRLTPAAELGASIRQVKEQLRGVPHKGIGFGVLRYLGDEAARTCLAELPVPRITFNYLGQLDGQFDERALFVPAAESAGEEQSPLAPLGNWLVLNGQVYGGELSLAFSFSGQMFARATIERLARAYEAELAALVEHCQAPQGLTPSDFPLAGLSQAQLDALPVAVAEIEDIYPLSPMQQGMLFHSLSDAGDDLYVNQLSLPVAGLEQERFRAAWQHVIGRHEILRTSFHWEGGQSAPLQVVHRHVDVAMTVLDWRARTFTAADLEAVARAQRGFDLGQVPLQRLLLVRTGDAEHQLVWTSHHILMDGWSSSQLFGEVLQHYASGEVTGDSGRYRDFIAWLQAQDQGRLQDYWQGRLRLLDAPTQLSQSIHPRHTADLPGHEALYTRWDAQRTAALQQHCRAQGITANTLIQGAWLLLLQRYTGQRSVAFGATVAGRPESLANAQHMLGLFINTLPVIQTLEPTQRLDQWLQQLQADNLDLREHAHAPLADIQRWSGQGGQALFDSIIVFENYPIDQRLEQAQGGLRFGASSSHDVTNFPMDLAVTLGETLAIEYLFLRSHFTAEAVQGIRALMETLLQSMIDSPAECIGNLQRLSPAQSQALDAWGAVPAQTGEPVMLAQLIARQAAARPEAIAAECAGQSLSYAALEARSDVLARQLLARGAGPEVLVGVALERSVDMLVALLAVFKSGAAYVPLDLNYPAERLAFMIQDSGMRQLIGRADLGQRLPLPVGLEPLDPATLACEAGTPASVFPVPGEHSLAYLIYTSGSTGVPKGVAVSHGPLSMHCQAIAELYEMQAGTRELHFMSFAFDGAHERWLTTLAVGGTLILRDNELWTPQQTCEALSRGRVDIACFPPAYLKQVAEYVQRSGVEPPPVRIYCLGGDAVPEQTLAEVREVLRPRYITNGYGPTETVVTPMLWKASAEEPCGAAYAPIGRVVGQRSLRVLDDDLNPLPVGFAGQLFIGGHGVARGYHQRPSITAERFVPDPFGEPGARFYRSGDLVRLRQSGILDYVGRLDHQVKVRGFRIELGEIEASLRQQPGVGDAVVIARDGVSGKQLIGYVAATAEVRGDQLKAALAETLPAYMVPLQVICLERLPVSPNGKLDRKALPEPTFDLASHVPPRCEEEQWMAQIWAEVLQVEQVGITDNFFELGGDSILSLQVISRVRNHAQLKLELKLRDLMRCQTIANLFDQQGVSRVSGEQQAVVVEGDFPLIPIQEWFFTAQTHAPEHFNQALILRANQPLDAQALERTLTCMLGQHDALRLRFSHEQGRWIQRYQPLQECLQRLGDDPLLWVREVADEEALEDLANELQRSLDLAQGPLMRGLLATLGNGQVRLLLVIHHLVIDGVSWRVLLQDLQEAYQALLADREPRLPQRTSSFGEWAAGLAGHAVTLRERELDYWVAQLDRQDGPLRCDNPRGGNLMCHREEAAFSLDAQRTAQLLKEAPAAYQTQINDLLLTALSRALCQWDDSASALVLLEGHGREDLFEQLDLSRTLGWFTSMYPVRLSPVADPGASIVAVREQLAQVPDKGIGYGVLRHMDEPWVRARLAELPQAQVTFNYLGQLDQSFDAEQALFLPAPESVGDSFSQQASLANWLEVVGQVFDGKLSFRCIYSNRRFRQGTITAFMDQFQAELTLLIEHCLQVQAN
ncbi:MAG: amino acid adenylation domain-containing protein [Gammaproteobacteria bacterium]|nr:amino acid adenylation domain-containing protein [Gammaproteobacteria bacterium]